MKITELLGKEKQEQINRIQSNPTITLEEAIEGPEKVSGKVIVFLGNWEGIDTVGNAVRMFSYDIKEGKWSVADKDLLDGFELEFAQYFDNDELRGQFDFFFEFSLSGYLLEED